MCTKVLSALKTLSVYITLRSYLYFVKKTKKMQLKFIHVCSSSFKSNLLSKGIDEDNSNLANLSTAVDEIKLGNEIFHGRTFFNKDATINNFYENAMSSKIVALSVVKN